jgi:hypothetical protein
MGNDPSLGEQTTIYSEFSDVVPPTVTSVPHRGPFVDCPTVTLSGQALATDLCGLPPLTVAGAGTTPAGMTFDATIPTTLKLPPGDTTIAWSATDGALNRSAAVIETITTTDVSPPTIGTRPAVTVETCSAGQTTVTLTPPTATDSCHPAPPVTGTVISLTPNVPVVDGQVSLPPGSHTVRWTASDGAGHTASSTQTVVVQPGILTKGQFLLRDRAQVQVVSGGPGGVGNAGSTLTEAGNDTRLGDIVSVARVLLRDRVTVQGAIRSASTITLGNGDVISGPIVPSTPVTLPPVPDLTGVVFPPPTGGNRTFNTTTTLAPGSYGSVTLNSPARVSLSAGSYFFQQLTLNSGASLVIPAAGVVKLFVSGGLAYRSQVIHSGGQAAQIFLGYNGTASPVLEAQFQGTLIAPRATVSMGTASARQFRGRFFARGLEIRPDARIVCDTTVTAR